VRVLLQRTMSNPTPAALPNPYTPLLYLPQYFADELEISRYVYVAALGVGFASNPRVGTGSQFIGFLMGLGDVGVR
jgi:hypothetical protein